MWKLLLDPVVQAIAFLAAISAFGYVVFDLYEDSRDPTPRVASIRKRPRKKPAEARAAPPPPRESGFVESSIEIWTDNQGETRGRVKRGPRRGMRLEDMTREDLEAQNAYCREHDYPAAVALEAYIRRRFSAQRRNDTRVDGTMTRSQALKELGLSDEAQESDVHAAYRRLIMKHHPDRGGSHAKAARINQAKDLLVG